MRVEATPSAVICSHSQRRLWFLDRLAPGSAAYNQSRVFHLAGDLDVARLARSLDTMIARHEILRTRFTSIDGEPLQCIDAAHPAALEVTDLSAVPDGERTASVTAVLETAAERPFDLDHGPLLRLSVFRLAPREHLLLRTLHHIVSDGWSAGLFERELAEIYDALGRDPCASFPSPALQYRDYARWQHARLDEAETAIQLDYWRTQLRALAPLPLPTDRPRPARSSDRGDVVTVALPGPLAAGMRALARSEGATAFMTLLAALAALLHRLTHVDDIAIGTPIAGRPRVEFERMLGFFANTLVLRNDASGDPTFRQLLRRVRETALAAFAHQDLPFEQVVEAVAPQRDPDRNPLFQVAFAHDDMHGPPLALDGLAVTRMPSPTRHAKFDLTLALRERDGRLEGHWEYRSDLFDRATVVRIAACYEALVEGIVADADRPIATLPLLCAVERRRILGEWSCAGGARPALGPLVASFELQAGQLAEHESVRGRSGALTYGALNAAANQLARHLAERGVAPGSIVGVAFERDVPMIVAMLAILKAGGGYLPIDPELPAERIAFMLADAGARAVVTEQQFCGRLPADGIAVFVVDLDAEAIRERPATNLGLDERPGALAYVMYTSGSTGTPKGVAIRRDSVVALVRDTNYVALTATDVVAQLSHAAFDAATFEIFGALLNGARLVILARDTLLSADAFRRARDEHAFTCVFLTTSLFNHLARERGDCFAGLPSLLFGGEAADRGAVRRVLAAGPPQRLVNGYGPTETTTFATFHVVQAGDPDGAIPIGRPIRGAEVYVLDENGELVPPGVVGELYIGGTGVASGYVGHASGSNERFVSVPFRPDARVFRTGDRVRWQPDGTLVFVGRNDDQLKIRGFRVEPAEVSAALARHPAVAASHVIPRRQVTGDLGLTAYVAPKLAGDPAASVVELRRHLAGCLPSYMLPATIVTLDALPLLPSGKVDVAALPDPAVAQVAGAQRHAPPRNEVERKLCELWRELLGVERIGIDDDFFELGGHSLLAAQLFARLDARFHGRVPLRALFEATTVRALAARVAAHPGDGTTRTQ